MVGVPRGVSHCRQKHNPADQPQNVNDQKNASLRFLLRYEIGYVGEAHVIAEGVNDEWRHEVPGANEQERRVNAEDWSVEELEERDYDRCFLIHSRPKTLDHVMEMC